MSQGTQAKKKPHSERHCRASSSVNRDGGILNPKAIRLGQLVPHPPLTEDQPSNGSTT